jgi:hypothetical protein
MDALEYQYHEGWRSVAEQSREIRELRHIDRVARESWAPALEAVRLSTPVSGAEVYEIVSSVQKMAEDPVSSIGYLMANEDVALHYINDSQSAWDHFKNYGRFEGRHLTHDPDAFNTFVSKLDRESSAISRRLEELAAAIVRAERPVSENEIQHLRKEIADLQNSYSWRITAPLRKLAKPFMERNGKTGSSH